GDRVRGLGHVSRCSAYADEWCRRGGRVIWMLDGDEAAAGLIQPGQEIRIRRWQDDAAGALTDPGAAVTLLDSYTAPAAVREAIAAMGGQTVFIDDLWQPWPAGQVVHPAPDRRPAEAPAAHPDSIWLEGPRWHPLRGPFIDMPPRAPTRERVGRVLVVFGGGDLRSIGATMAELAHAVWPDAAVDLVLGAGQERLVASPHLTVHQALDAGAMARLMQDADVAISGAGQTIFELARCGTPTVMVGIADNQRANLEQWPSLCGFIDAGSWDGADLSDRVRKGLIALGPARARQDISARAGGIVDGQGVRRLFDHLGQVSLGPGQIPDRFGQAEPPRIA
ncbi:MAG: hypothetical protein K2X25_11690, partial [Caulobacteraceae bacterium]|nr:hypothetical protein [Caulobacteraceae bacterium]